MSASFDIIYNQSGKSHLPEGLIHREQSSVPAGHSSETTTQGAGGGHRQKRTGFSRAPRHWRLVSGAAG